MNQLRVVSQLMLLKQMLGLMGLKGQLHSDALVIRHTCVVHLEVGDGDRMSDNMTCWHVGRGLNSLEAAGNQRQRQEGLLMWVFSNLQVSECSGMKAALGLGGQ